MNQSLFNSCTNIYHRADFKELTVAKYWMNGVNSLVFEVFGLLGNMVAIWTLCRPTLRTAFNQLLIFGSLIDMMFLLSNVPNTVHALGSDLLKPVAPTAEICSRVFICASVLMVIALSYERQFAICMPHTYRINLKTVPRWRHLMKYIGPVIFCSLAFNLPIFLSMKAIWRTNPTFIKINLYLRAVHPLTTTGWLPIVLLCLFNYKIVKGMQNLKRPGLYQQLSVSVSTERSRKVNKRHFKEIKATYMAFAIVVCFSLLNTPRLVASMIETAHMSQIVECVEHGFRYIPSKSFFKLDFLARMCMVMNSAINVIIYCLVSSPFQKVIRLHFFHIYQRIKTLWAKCARFTSPEMTSQLSQPIEFNNLN